MQEVVLELQRLIDTNGWKDMFTEAVATAHKQNIPRLQNVHTLEDYFEWINALLEWIPSETRAGDEIYSRLCEFYFFLDQEPVKHLQNKIESHDQSPELTELSLWMVDYANAWGRFLDTPESLTAESIQSFYDSPGFNMDEYMPAPGGWKTFNQFFARHVRPGARPIDDLCDDRVIVSAADSTFVGAWPLDEESTITVKGLRWSILELLEGSPFRDRFQGGLFAHSFLNTTDYHRLHVPVAGTVLESRTIHGQVYLDVQAVADETTPGACRIHAIRRFHAEDGTGYQFAQARGLLVLDSPIGLVAVLPIGMAQVSSVVMTAEVGANLHKGEGFGYFQFGGSDHIVLFEAAAAVELSAQPDLHYKQGVEIGRSRKANRR